MKRRYLTKSRFKLACECESKLFYTRKKEYADQSADDPFMMELAKGGYQVGEIAKYYFTNNASEITVEERDSDKSLEETKKRIDQGDQYIAEAAILFENLFIRVDIFDIDKEKQTINIFEVKSKSYSSEVDFYSRKRGTNEIIGIRSDWKSYLYDVAFQKHVVTKAYPEYQVNTYLTLVNKDAITTVEGLNQNFKVIGTSGNYQVVIDKNLTMDKLGNKILIDVNVDEFIDYIWGNPIDSLIFPNYGFIDYIKVLSKRYQEDEKINTPISPVCKKCQFYNKDKDNLKGLKDGFKECWVNKLQITDEKFLEPKITELCYLYGGKLNQDLIDQSKYFISQITEDDILKKEKDDNKIGLTLNERRWEQISRTQENNQDFYLDKTGLKQEMDKWTLPLHFIDFETASPALPFTKGVHPYEGIAFQYSHHTVSKTKDAYKIKHESQFINIERENPNLDFIRNLKKDLSKDHGTIFRYHNHENTYLRKIYKEVEKRNDIPDKNELLQFIDSITQYKVDKEYILGHRNMVDLWKLVVDFYYSPHAKGSTSLKKILPAAINDSSFLKSKYSNPICGKTKEVTSLNFDSKIWIDHNYDNDPYKTLPPVFENFSRDELDEMFDDMNELADGGAAMMAYAKLQFFDTIKSQRNDIKEALYRYCELDTLAMVMLWEFWNNEVNN